MEKKFNPWIVRIALGVALVALVGFSFFPLFAGISENRGTQTASPTTAAKSTPEAQKAELQDLEKGYLLVLQREPDNQVALEALLKIRIQMVSQGFVDVKNAKIQEPLEKLVQLNPDRTQYSVLLAQTYQQTGDREAAARIYRSVLATKPGDAYALPGLVSLLMQQNQPEAAIELLQTTINQAPQANKLQPNSVDVPSVQLLLAQVYAQQQRDDEAIAIYDQVSTADKNDFRPVYAKAMILKRQGKLEAAKPLFESATALAPAQFKDRIKQDAGLTPKPEATPGSTTAPTTPSNTTPATPTP